MEEEGLVLNLHGEVPSDHAKVRLFPRIKQNTEVCRTSPS